MLTTEGPPNDPEEQFTREIAELRAGKTELRELARGHEDRTCAGNSVTVRVAECEYRGGRCPRRRLRRRWQRAGLPKDDEGPRAPPPGAPHPSRADDPGTLAGFLSDS